ncbi:AraC family transcriptional regulator [Sphingobium sp. Sx8-8]|uniref:helix-turn-helix transcriptional regulator n=1 Tax=Sphingobium sp. Sx8-8 TaxID=2933617 RepID=UPI001F57BB48|nr:AraC family transcriptional regulator [Sphingobium sp. Sx8-8]
MTARACHVSAAMELDDVNIQVVDYRWSANEQITECEDMFILRYRPRPGPVSVAAHMRHGEVRDFGQLMFFPARTAVETTPAKVNERARTVECAFKYDWFRRIWPERDDWDDEALARCYDMRNFRVEQAMQRLGMEAESPGFASHLMAESLAQSIAIDLARHFTSRNSARRVRTSDGRFSANELNRIRDYIDSITQRAPTVDEISRQCGISSAHLRRSFKQTTGQTLHEYVASVRLAKARSLLAETDMPLKEVAFRLGFASSSTFSSTFSKMAGETPSGYRQRLLDRR